MTSPASLEFTIYQGATFSETHERETVPYGAHWACGQLVKDDCGTPVPPEDITPEDYTDCEARMLLWAQVGNSTVEIERTSQDGHISLSGKEITFTWTAAETEVLAWRQAAGIVEITRQSGEVERQYNVCATVVPKRPQ
ncbi:hypothetical protein [Ottowia sp. VDI28]|uniref:hypothetical protein n=1 Tax=Ottowia sp. VDI28 TaxID=3133968 RepID=UPI003C2EB845